jgi:hypothetical protein
MTHEDQIALEAYQEDQRAMTADEQRLLPGYLAGYREAARAGLHFANDLLVYILNSDDANLAAWGIAYGINAPVCGGVSEDERARKIGKGRAAISRRSREFQRGMNLPLAAAMRDSAGPCADARGRQLSPPLQTEEFDREEERRARSRERQERKLSDSNL